MLRAIGNASWAALVVGLFFLTTTPLQAQFRNGAVGGVKVDAQGLLSNPDRTDTAQLLAAWEKGHRPAPADLQQYVDLRFVSLRGIEKELAKAHESGEPVPDAVNYLAGLLRVKYVLIYPERGDIVLAGPAEGWKVDTLGNTVGATTGRPLLMLDDLIVALRNAEKSNGAGISCSIDPTAEGLQRANQLRRDRNRDPAQRARKLEQALGDQVITVSGAPATSHFARVLVAADFRMKRLAMGLERSPTEGLPSYFDLLPNRSSAANSMLPRWWLATHYEPLKTDGDGLAWELRGQGVKCMTEESVLSEAGALKRTGKANKFAQQWADLMTERFEDLANHDSSFGHLRNAMDLAVAAAILSKERAFERAKLDAPWLAEQHSCVEYSAPRRVATKANLTRKGDKWIVSASGGVQMYPWEVADKSEQSAEVVAVHQQASGENATWWWQ